jgi:hypothetical protein
MRLSRNRRRKRNKGRIGEGRRGDGVKATGRITEKQKKKRKGRRWCRKINMKRKGKENRI